jgi:hypothetical protein
MTRDMTENQNGRTRILNKTFIAWLTGLLLLIVVCVVIPGLFPALSWTHFLFPAAVVAGPVALMILERRANQGKPPQEDKQIFIGERNKPDGFNEEK